MSIAQYTVTDETALAWCNKLHAEGIELNMHWDGGGDSGWVEFQIDKADLTDEDREMISYLENKCYDELDYGSWAGEFYASGDAAFDPEQNAFVGIDSYSEDTSLDVDCELRIAVSKDVWFDQIEIALEDEEINAKVDVIVRNGFKTDVHHAAEKALATSIEEQVNIIITEKVEKVGHEYRSMWEQITLSKNDFTLEGDEMVHTLKSLSVGIYESDDKSIFINLSNEE